MWDIEHLFQKPNDHCFDFRLFNIHDADLKPEEICSIVCALHFNKYFKSIVIKVKEEKAKKKDVL